MESAGKSSTYFSARALVGLCIPMASFILIACSSERKAMVTLKEKINIAFSKQQGEFALAFLDLSSQRRILINDTVSFHAASTMKTPVMAEVYRQASAGKFSLSDSILVKNEFKSIADGSNFQLDSVDDSETDLYKHAGEKKTVAELLYKMITVSSNFSTNLIIQLVGADNVNKYMQEIGAKGILVLRGVEDGKAFAKGMNNKVTAYGLMRLFEKMGREELVSAKASEEMIAILSDQQFKDIIPAGLPPGTRVAHKTGFITGVHHDSGIVFLPDGRKYVLVLLPKDLKDEKSAIAMMAGVSKMIWDYMQKKKG